MKKYMILISIIILVMGCSKKAQVETKPSNDPFYEKHRFIMTKEERDFYKHLPTVEARDDFIREFWEKRDPSPGTDINENRLEYEARIEYANKWFREGRPGRGWDTARGRILLVLGEPDRRNFGEVTQSRYSTKAVGIEYWYYYWYQLYLRFVDYNGFGKYELDNYPAALLTAMDRAKFSLDLRDRENLKKAFKFDLKSGSQGIKIQVPINKVSFEENEATMKANFKITLYVYLNHKKIDLVKTNKSIVRNKEDLLKSKSKFIEFEIPYTMKEKGKYYFDIIIEETGTGAKYRRFYNYKIK